MGKQYTEDIVGEVLSLGIDQEGLLGKAVPAMSEPRCGLKSNPCLAPFDLAHGAFKTAGTCAFDSGFVFDVAKQIQQAAHAELESGGQDCGQKENAQCAFVLETGTPKP